MKSWLWGRVGRWGGLAALCATAAFATGAPAASAKEACTAVTGSGSSLQAIAQESVWSTNTGWKELCSNPTEASVSYKGTSSGKGMNEWGAGSGSLDLAESPTGTLDAFVGTDVGPEGTETTGQIGNMDKAGESSGSVLNGVVDVPIAQSAISVIASLPSTCTPTGPLVVNNEALAEAYAGKTVTFNTLFGIAGCNVNLTHIFARSAPSGTTAGFKRYLKALEKLFKKVFGPGVKTYTNCTETAAESESTECWPELAKLTENAKTEKGGGLAEEVAKTEGSIGYADLADAIKQKFPVDNKVAKIGTNGYDSFIAEVPNEKSETESTAESPEVPTGTEAAGASNCAEASHEAKYENVPTAVASNENWSNTQQKERTSNVAVYPICTLTNDLFWHRYSFVHGAGSYTHAQYETALSYIFWIVNSGETGTPLKELKEKQYAPLPSAILTEAQKGVTMTNIEY